MVLLILVRFKFSVVSPVCIVLLCRTCIGANMTRLVCILMLKHLIGFNLRSVSPGRASRPPEATPVSTMVFGSKDLPCQ